MRAIVCPAFGDPAVLSVQELPVPEPGACHVQIKVRAAGLNFADTVMLEGRYQDQPSPPFVPGMEVAGTVEAVGAGAGGLLPGQRVLALTGRGGFAEFAIATQDDVVPIPDEMPFDIAAGFAVTYGTAFGALAWRAGLHAGDTLLVGGAAGGVGLAAVECGKALGARVIALARGREKLDLVRDHGADEAFDSEAPDLVDRLKEACSNGVDVVFDPVGAPVFKAAMKLIAWEGRIVLIGFASGALPDIRANHLLVKNAAVLGFTWSSYRRHDPDRLREAYDTLFGWYRAGRLRPHVAARLRLEEAASGLERLLNREVSGKLVLDLGS